MNIHTLYGRFCLSYNLTNGEWWVQDRFEHMGAYSRYAKALAAINKKMEVIA
jgi:hypothetical protein